MSVADEENTNVTVVQIASVALGAVVGLIAVAIFALILRRIEKSKPRDAIKSLYELIGLALGGGIVDYAIFDRILESGAIFYYVIGFAGTFLVLGLAIFIDWLRR